MELQERPYKFGESVDLVISVTADFEYRVREGQVELMCDGVYTQSREIMVPDRSARASAFHPRALSHHPMPQIMVPKRISEEQHFRFLVGRTVFARPG